MLDFKRILVPYDGSVHAKKALQAAADIYQCSDDGATLFIATVSPPISVTENIAMTHAYVLERENDTEGRRKGELPLSEAASLLPKETVHELLYSEGDPGEALLGLANEKDCDLIVMGSRGRGAITSLFLGSVSAYISANASCPVCIIK